MKLTATNIPPEKRISQSFSDVLDDSQTGGSGMLQEIHNNEAAYQL